MQSNGTGVTHTALSQESFSGIEYANFKRDEYSYLNITNIASELVDDDNECGFACLEISSCFSYNLAAIPDINGKLLCELLPSDKYNNSEKFVASQLFNHFSIRSPCSSTPCMNNGKCVSLYHDNSYVCVCKRGFIGKNCQMDINACRSNPCLNNGTCTDLVNRFNCTCTPGFAGNRCQTDINECRSNPCLNNGTCTDLVDGFNCTCKPGFAGKRCQTDINECRSNPCLNNGTCTDLVDGFNCTCKPRFAGIRCQAESPTSCLDYLRRGSSKSGTYKIYDKDGNSYTAYCDLTSESGTAWTLVMSWSKQYRTLPPFRNIPFKYNSSVNENAQNWSQYRLSLVRMKSLQNNSTHWRSTCSYPKYGVDFRDYVRGNFMDFDIVDFIGAGQCKKVEIINIRGHVGMNVTVQFWQGLNQWTLHTDSSFKSCQFDAKNGSVNSEDNFGFYGSINGKFRCTEASTSTTQWWFGGHL